MADITITATSVKRVSGAVHNQNNFGETVTAGMPVYLKVADAKWYKIDNNVDAATSGVGATATGIALNGGAVDQPAVVLTSGDVDIGATVVVGEVYVASQTAGGIAPHGDLASGNFVTYIGYAITTGRLRLMNVATNTTKA